MAEAKQDRMQYCGVNHVALVARDMAETVDFYQNILEMPLVKTVDYPNNHGQHFFFDCGGGRTVAFFWWPEAPEVAEGIASPPRDFRQKGIKTAHGSMNHLAFTIPPELFDEYVEKLRARGLHVFTINHGDAPGEEGTPDIRPSTFIRSLSFFDPNGVLLEFSAQLRDYNEKDVAHDPVNAQGVKQPTVVGARQAAE
jgi:catechol 2,3-dioxygenase-like lactoylglutathione lyase family enzyme